MSYLGIKGELSETTVKKEFVWEILNFFSLSAAVGSFYSSPSFTVENASFHLIVYPAGQRVARPGYLSLFLENENSCKYNITCRFSIKKSDGTLIVSRGGTVTITSFAGYTDLCKKSALESELLPSSTLTICCTLELKRDQESDIINAENLEEKQVLETVDRTKFTELAVLSENLRNLYSNVNSCDTVLQVKDKEFKAHKTILMARSPVFAAMFQHDTLEKQTGFIDIPDCDPESFQQFLQYLYCGKVEDISYRTAIQLYNTSNKYDVKELKEFCVDHLMNGLTADNVCEVAIFADNYDETNLLSAIQDFFTKNFGKIFLTTEWENFMRNNTRLANKLLIEMSKIKG